jgi:hypothetical protein
MVIKYTKKLTKYNIMTIFLKWSKFEGRNVGPNDLLGRNFFYIKKPKKTPTITRWNAAQIYSTIWDLVKTKWPKRAGGLKRARETVGPHARFGHFSAFWEIRPFGYSAFRSKPKIWLNLVYIGGAKSEKFKTRLRPPVWVPNDKWASSKQL